MRKRLRFVLTLAATAMLAACADTGGFGRPPAGTPAPRDNAIVRRTGPIPTLAQLQSADILKLEQYLGTPEIRRRDMGTEMWTYAAPECALLLFLYPDANGVFHVAHVEASPGGAAGDGLARCIHAAATRPLPITS